MGKLERHDFAPIGGNEPVAQATVSRSCCRLVLTAVFSLVLLSSVATRGRAAVELTELLNEGSSFTVESLVFDQFTYAAEGSMPSPAGILVDAVTDVDGNVGIIVSGGFSDTPMTDGPSSLDIGYRVTASDGQTFAGATLAGNPAVIGEGTFTITESSGGFEMSLVVFDSVPGETQLLESVELDGQSSSLDVLLSLVGDVDQGAGTASFAQQTFALADGPDGVVPEPSTMLIWGLTIAMAGSFGAWQRRRNGSQDEQ